LLILHKNPDPPLFSGTKKDTKKPSAPKVLQSFGSSAIFYFADKTRRFPPPSLKGFGFIWIYLILRLFLTRNQINIFNGFIILSIETGVQ